MSNFESYCNRKRAEHGEKFDASALASQFILHFNVGDTRRVKVEFPWTDIHGKPEVIWGYVSVTMGWRPTFILMRRRGQIGSSDVLTADCEILAYRDIK